MRLLPSTLPTFGPVNHEIRYHPAKTSIYIENMPLLLDHVSCFDGDYWLCASSDKGKGIKSLALDANLFVLGSEETKYFWEESIWIELFKNMFPGLEDVVVLIDYLNFNGHHEYLDCTCHQIRGRDPEVEFCNFCRSPSPSLNGDNTDAKTGDLPLSKELEDTIAFEKEAYLALSPSQLFEEEIAGEAHSITGAQITLF